MAVLSTHDSMVLLVDMQQGLLPAIDQREELLRRAERLLRAAQLLGVPVMATEHCRDKIGPTLPELRKWVDHVLPKTYFDAAREKSFQAEMPAGRHRVLLIGTEAHVCVLQTGMGLAALGFAPVLVSDCIGSRKPSDQAAACLRWQHYGLEMISSEMAMFEWLESPAHPQFKEVLSIIKEP